LQHRNIEVLHFLYNQQPPAEAGGFHRIYRGIVFYCGRVQIKRWVNTFGLAGRGNLPSPFCLVGLRSLNIKNWSHDNCRADPTASQAITDENPLPGMNIC